METGKTTKYLKYAIGEIILVMIGILLALQVNNWNENNKAKTKLTNALIEVKKDLNIEVTVLNRNIDTKTKDLNAQMQVIQVLDKEIPIYPEFTNDLGHVFLRREVLFSKSGYELIKELGLSDISNNLRNSLVRYYDIIIPAIKIDINDDAEELSDVWLPYLRNHFYDFKYGEYAIPKDINQFVNDSYILSALKINIGNVNGTIGRLKEGKALGETLIDLITEELKKTNRS